MCTQPRCPDCQRIFNYPSKIKMYFLEKYGCAFCKPINKIKDYESRTEYTKDLFYKTMTVLEYNEFCI